jgi:lipoprotein-releasing system ATP-binding protein
MNEGVKMKLIDILNLNKSFKKGPDLIHVLNNFNLTVLENDFISIVGPSGAGKSTLLHIIGGLDKPDSGEIRFMGQNIFSKESDMDKYRNEQVGFVFQFHYLLNDFNALENVAMPALIKGDKKKSVYDWAERMLEKVGLKDRMKHLPKELSGGEQQRVAVARALMNQPKLLLADEPTGNLDKENSNGIFELFQSLNNDGLTILLVTHDELLAKMTNKEVRLEKL